MQLIVAHKQNVHLYGELASGESYYNYFRDQYNPKSGRYLQSDPIGLKGGINTYGYVGGNPARWADPLGLEPINFSYSVYVYTSGNVGFNGHVGGGATGLAPQGFRGPGGTSLGHMLNRDYPGEYDADKKMGINSAPNYTIKFPMTFDQLQRALARERELKTNPGKYNAYSRNCSTIQHDILKDAGIDVGWKPHPFDWLPDVDPTGASLF